ncbi:PH domain-containing protein [Catellatospora aurea]|uniref:PH domain-containing protein n=1 Tax=Catellatospora aurea TaxID=1337874 RepID=A0ABW2GP14_9ACTN
MSRDSGRGDEVEHGPQAHHEIVGLRLSPPPMPVLPLAAEPSGTAAIYLFPTERFRGEWRRHGVSLVKALCLVAVYTGLLSMLAAQQVRPEYTTRVIVLIAAGGVLFAAHRVADWRVSRFVLTNKRLMLVQGVFSRRVAMMPLLRMADLSYYQSPLGRLFGFGVFRVESAGWFSPLRRIADLPSPNELYLRIVEELYEPDAVEARLGAAVPEPVSRGTELA